MFINLYFTFDIFINYNYYIVNVIQHIDKIAKMYTSYKTLYKYAIQVSNIN